MALLLSLQTIHTTGYTSRFTNLGKTSNRGVEVSVESRNIVEINQCARMSLMLRRAPAAAWLTDAWQEKMHKIEQCRRCGHCVSKCPYGLNTPELLQANYRDYWQVLDASRKEKSAE